MKIQDYVKQYLGEYKQIGSEMRLKNCPFCNREKKFYINSITGNYICFSGSCGEKGNFEQLMTKLGKPAKVELQNKTVAKEKELMQTVKVGIDDVEPIDDSMVRYFEKRGISEDTVKKMRVLKAKKTNDMLFFITAGQETKEKAKIVGVKTRTIDKKIRAYPGSKSFLLFWELIPAEEDTIIITEGEIDALSLVEAGFNNVCSVPFGTNNVDWIDNQKGWLLTKKEIILWFDNDTAGKAGLDKTIKRLHAIGVKSIKKIKTIAPFKDANEVLVNEGILGIMRNVDLAEKINITGITDVTEIGRFNINTIDRFTVGINGLDYALSGFKESELTILAGDNASGKTTLTGQIMLSAIENDKKVFLYNGELDERMLKEWLYAQASPEIHFEEIRDNITNKIIHRLKDDRFSFLNEVMKNKLFINTELTNANADELLIKMDKAYKDYNVFLFVIDNLTTLTFTGTEPRHEQLSNFIARVKEFAKERKVTVLIINHVTKNKDNEKASIRGGTGVTDLADNVIMTEIKDNESCIKILKNRMFGITIKVPTVFSQVNKRIMDAKNYTKEKNKKYKFDNFKKFDIEELPF
jgi:twinkle protein